jgi:enoyl-CoA hydratase/carnithine racemase
VTSEHVLYEARDGIATITLNRPEKLNALTDDMVRALRVALDSIDEDESVLVGVLRGAGRCFSSGADVRQRQLRPLEEIKRFGGPAAKDARTADLMVRFTHWKPVLASVHGYVMGAALHIALACEMIVAAAETQFQITEMARGVNGTGAWALLADLSGASGFATDVAITGRFWTAAEGQQAGVVARVVPLEELEAETLRIAQVIASNPPQAVRALVKRRRIRLEQVELETRAVANTDIYLTRDFRESATAFVEKRPTAPFTGQ